MNTNLIFRLKFAYKGEKDDGKLTKKKLEVLAQCVNYTDAETLASQIIKNEEMNKYEECEYEIVLTKLKLENILLNDTMYDGDEVQNLKELYFSGEQDGIFQIKARFLAKDEGEKDTSDDYLVPGETINDAVTYLKKYLVNVCGYKVAGFTISSSKVDNAENLYLKESVYEKKIALKVGAGDELQDK